MKTSRKGAKDVTFSFSGPGLLCNLKLRAGPLLSKSFQVLRASLPITALAVLVLTAGCAEPEPKPTTPAVPTRPPPTPSPTPEPVVLTVCLPEEPDSLYLYGTNSQAAQHVWQAIYDGPLDTRNYAYQPVILTSLPSFANGDVTVKTVVPQAGNRVCR